MIQEGVEALLLRKSLALSSTTLDETVACSEAFRVLIRQGAFDAIVLLSWTVSSRRSRTSSFDTGWSGQGRRDQLKMRPHQPCNDAAAFKAQAPAADQRVG
jgi:hypothetical protein